MTDDDNGLEIDEGIDTQHRMWSVERAGRWVLGVVVVVALLGFLGGSGPFSSTSVNDGSLDISYDRFVRAGAETRLVVTASDVDDTVVVSVDADYLDGVVVRAVTPQPAGVTTAGNKVEYEFTTGSPQFRATFDIEPRSMGMVRGTFAVGPEQVAVSHVVHG